MLLFGLESDAVAGAGEGETGAAGASRIFRRHHMRKRAAKKRFLKDRKARGVGTDGAKGFRFKQPQALPPLPPGAFRSVPFHWGDVSA